MHPSSSRMLTTTRRGGGGPGLLWFLLTFFILMLQINTSFAFNSTPHVQQRTYIQKADLFRMSVNNNASTTSGHEFMIKQHQVKRSSIGSILDHNPKTNSFNSYETLYNRWSSYITCIVFIIYTRLDLERETNSCTYSPRVTSYLFHWRRTFCKKDCKRGIYAKLQTRTHSNKEIVLIRIMSSLYPIIISCFLMSI